MNYNVASVQNALDSVSQICDRSPGSRVVFEVDGGYIETAAGSRVPFIRRGDTYIRQVWVPSMPNVEKVSGFGRPGPRAS